MKGFLGLGPGLGGVGSIGRLRVSGFRGLGGFGFSSVSPRSSRNLKKGYVIEGTMLKATSVSRNRRSCIGEWRWMILNAPGHLPCVKPSRSQA